MRFVAIQFAVICFVVSMTLELAIPHPAFADETSPRSTIDFNRDIRPILSENCFFCHGPDPETREAGLRLDDREEAIDFGAIVPGDVQASELINRIEHADPKWIMPPPQSHKTLTEVQKQKLITWIAEGAPYQLHWSFSLIQRPEIPTLPANTAAPRNPVDAFVRHRLISVDADLSPRSRPDRLLRRLYLDLIGLPPTPDQTRQFIEAAERDFDTAYSHALNELLASDHHGERMASFWLDVVRYSDTVGFHGDQTQNIFPYRDWVINAFNQNMPFDQFTRKQLAGDLLPDATTEDLIASGFNRLNMMTREGGAQPGEYLAKYAADRVRTVGMAWMGLTTGCAECHDHKFDPFTAKDFYSLGAFFADIQQWGVYSDYHYTPNTDLKGFNNDFPFPPEIEITSQPLLREQAQARTRLARLAEAEVTRLDEKGKTGVASWWHDAHAFLQQHPTGWRALDATEEPVPNDANDAPKKGSKRTRNFVIQRDALQFNASGNLGVSSVRVNVSMPRPSNSRRLEIRFFVTPSASSDQAAPDQSSTSTQDGKSTQANKPVQPKAIKVVEGRANRWLPQFRSTVVQDDVITEWVVPAVDSAGQCVKARPLQYRIDRSHGPSEPMQAVFQFASPLKLDSDKSLRIEVSGGDGLDLTWESSPLGRLRPFDPAEIETLLMCEDTDAAVVNLAWVLSHRGTRKDQSAIERTIGEYHTCRDGKTFTMVAQSVEPIPMRVLPRGNWQDQTGETVLPAVPEFLNLSGEAKETQSTPRRLSRLDLAAWIVDPQNPLTARVVVNRLWKQFFGSGITQAADDLGAQGDPPSHPQLLDFLASELIESGWDLRHVLRIIVQSDTYRQDSRVVASLAEVDPENRLLAYHPPRRLEAEIVRDNALAISGLLNLEVGGPPAKPYQPAGYYSNLQFPNRDYDATLNDDQYRRGIYMHWQRTFLHPMLANFDAPSREDCVALRANANTPQQALTLLNDPTFLEAAGQFAYNQLVATGSNSDVSPTQDSQRIRNMIQIALQREATSEEIDRMLAFLSQQRSLYAQQPELVEQLAAVGLASKSRDWTQLDSLGGKSEWAAWTATARVLLNLHECITRY